MLTAEVVAEIVSLLVEGVSLGEVAQKLGLKLDTLRKAVSAGQIRPIAKKKGRGEPVAASTKSERSEIDCAAPMGRGATATLERIAASVGLLAEVEPGFERAVDLPHGGVLLERCRRCWSAGRRVERTNTLA